MMAVRETSTGGPLNRRVRREADIDDLPAVLEVMAGIKIHARSSKNYVKAIASHCAELLQDRGIDPDPPGAPEAAEAAGCGHPSPYWYVAEIVRLAHAIQGQIDVGHSWAAVRFGIRLGRMDVLGAITHYDRQAAGREQGRKEQARKNQVEADLWRIPARQEAKKIWAKQRNLNASAVARCIQRRGIAKNRSLRAITGAIAKVRPN
jgi:hypothetical protein